MHRYRHQNCCAGLRTVGTQGIAAVIGLLVSAFTATFVHAQPPAGERVEVRGSVAGITRDILTVTTDTGVIRIGMGLENMPLPGGGFFAEPGRTLDFEIEIYETPSVLRRGQFVRLEQQCSSTTLIPTKDVEVLELLSDDPGIRPGWTRLDNDEVEEAEAGEIDADAAPDRFEPSVGDYEIIGSVQRIDPSGVTIKVGTRRVQLPTGDQTTVSFQSTDSRLLSVGDEVVVNGRQLGPMVLASRVRATHYGEGLKEVVERRQLVAAADPAAGDEAMEGEDDFFAEGGLGGGAPLGPDGPGMPRGAEPGAAKPAPGEKEALAGSILPKPLREGPPPPGKYFGRRLKIN